MNSNKFYFYHSYRTTKEIASLLKVTHESLLRLINKFPLDISAEEFEGKIIAVLPSSVKPSFASLEKGKFEKPKPVKSVKKKKLLNTNRVIRDLGNLEGKELQKGILLRLNMYKMADDKRGLENNLDIDWFKKNILWKPCVYCGDWDYIGCDRIDNSKGHLKDNCVPCCCTCNLTRGDRFTYEEMKEIGQVIRKIKKSRTNS